jgi:predicted transcriptional regulator of viral defense system
MKMSQFLSRNPHAVFSLGELDQFLQKQGTTNRATRNALLSYYRRKGRVVHVKRGLYVEFALGSTPESGAVDPFLIAAKMTPDAVLAYHTALEFYGKAYSVFNRFLYFSNRFSVPVHFRNYEFRCVLTPRKLKAKGRTDFGVKESEHSGISLRVTSFERTLVDVLDRPDLSGGWEEIWRSLELVEFFDLDVVVEYAVLLGNATTAAKVGFFLEQHRDSLMVEDAYLKRLQDLRPRHPSYMDYNQRKSGRLVSGWNLVVPKEVYARSWEEVL